MADDTNVENVKKNAKNNGKKTILTMVNNTEKTMPNI